MKKLTEHGGNAFILESIRDARMINVEQAMNLYHLLSRVVLLGVPGEVVELGCHRGRTAVLLQRTLQQLGAGRVLHVFDSFEGLPEPTEEDGDIPCGRGSMSCSLQELFDIFAQFETPAPIVHCGWFHETLKSRLPDQIAFAHLDGDLYESIKISLQEVYPRLAAGAVAVIDDYFDPDLHPRINELLNENCKNREHGLSYRIRDVLPGVRRACDEFFADKPERVEVLAAGMDCHCYFRKL